MKNMYNVYSEYLAKKYGEKVYKIPINIPVTCPNRDGKLGKNGCIFCGEDGAGHENLSNKIPIKEQINQNVQKIQKKYKAKKFIAYFQNFTNTYLCFESFKKYILQSCTENIVEIAISTRPDCIHDKYLEFLNQVRSDKKVEITFELGLQTVNYHTLNKLNRGHSLAEFIDAVLRIKKYNFEICAHIILDIPWDNMYDVIENAKIISSLKVEQVKLHSLYIIKGTELSKAYEKKEFNLISKDEYIDRVITFLEYLDPKVVVQRLIGRAPKENTIIVNWNTSWWKIKSEIDIKMSNLKSFQGKKFNYLDGKILTNLI